MKYHKIENGLLFDPPEIIIFPRGMRYGSEFCINASYTTTIGSQEKMKFVDYKGPVDLYIRYPESVDEFRTFPELKFSDGKYSGEVEISERNPFKLFMHARENSLQIVPKPVESKIKKYVSAADAVLYELNLTPGSFNKEHLNLLLNWMRKNLKYVSNKGTLRNEGNFDEHGETNCERNIIIDRVGNCARFSCFLDYLVKRLGGYSRNPGGYAINFPIDGIPVFMSGDETEYDLHAWTEVYMNDKWHVVDPTVYINASEGLQERAIDKTRDTLFVETPYPVFYFPKHPDFPKNAVYPKLVDFKITF